jgi:hypothetical protein
MRCDEGHEHESLSAALACVRNGNPGTKGYIAGRPKVAPHARINTGDSQRVSVTVGRVGTRRGGRPRKYESDAIANRERQRRYRARRRAQSDGS